MLMYRTPFDSQAGHQPLVKTCRRYPRNLAGLHLSQPYKWLIVPPLSERCDQFNLDQRFFR